MKNIVKYSRGKTEVALFIDRIIHRIIIREACVEVKKEIQNFQGRSNGEESKFFFITSFWINIG